VGPEICLARRPPLVYGRATGWGRTGPLANTAGHDINYLALSGALGLIGPKDGPPTPPLNLVADYGGGALYLAFGVLSAVFEARASGRGQVVDLAMLDGVTSLLALFHAMSQLGQLVPRRGENLLDGGAPYYTVYPALDNRYLAVGAVEPRFYKAFLERLGLDSASLPAQNDRARWPELRARIAARFLTRTRDDWAAHFAVADACVSPVLSLEEAGRHPHNLARETLVEVDGVRQPHPAPRLSRTPGSIQRHAPAPGEHSGEVLRDFGFSEPEIRAGMDAGFLAGRRVD
jgi:alpha-methylacyl-CoA racemase